MVTFEQAREIVEAEHAPAWRDLGNRGEYMVADYGFEDSVSWLMVEGAREAIEGGDPAFAVLDQPLTFVSKADGTITTADYLDVADLVDAMARVGDHPDDDPDAA